MVYLNEKYGNVSFDETLNCLSAKLMGFISADNFKKIINKEIEVVKAKRPVGCLIDLTELQVMVSENQDYVQEYWFPNVIKYGLKYAAFLVPADVFGKVSMESANDVSDASLEIRYFNSAAAAKEWLAEKPEIKRRLMVNA